MRDKSNLCDLDKTVGITLSTAVVAKAKIT